MAPTGPKKGGSRNPPASTGKSGTRGGISKRRGAGPLKVDRDGDLSMDASAATNASQSHPKRAKGNATSSAPATRGTGPRNPRPTTKAQQIIQRVINGETSQVSSRTRSNRRTDIAPLVTLKVEGLKNSKAASNAGGGLKELLTFLERKAQSIDRTTRPIRIKKVCYSLPPSGLGGYEATHVLRYRYAI